MPDTRNLYSKQPRVDAKGNETLSDHATAPVPERAQTAPTHVNKVLKLCHVCKAIGDVRINFVRTIRPKWVAKWALHVGQTGAGKTCTRPLVPHELLWNCGDVLSIGCPSASMVYEVWV